MPFRATFACLWCGTSHSTRSDADLEGWAQLCPTCLGKAGDNNFLRSRLRLALTERGAPGVAGAATAPAPATVLASDVEAEMAASDEARAADDDDWYLRRGRYARGAIHDAAWDAELDMAGRWLDDIPFRGELVDLAAGTGWWSTLLAGKGELSLYDTSPSALDRARDRLLAHGLRAHLHVRDAWTEPDRQVDGLFVGFWLRHVERERLADFLALVRRWLKPGGRVAFLDSLPDPASGAADHPLPRDDRAIRRPDDGREADIITVHRRPDEYAAALRAAGLQDVVVGSTGRFFVHGSARRPDGG